MIIEYTGFPAAVAELLRSYRIKQCLILRLICEIIVGLNLKLAACDLFLGLCHLISHFLRNILLEELVVNIANCVVLQSKMVYFAPYIIAGLNLLKECYQRIAHIL